MIRTPKPTAEDGVREKLAAIRSELSSIETRLAQIQKACRDHAKEFHPEQQCDPWAEETCRYCRELSEEAEGLSRRRSDLQSTTQNAQAWLRKRARGLR